MIKRRRKLTDEERRAYDKAHGLTEKYCVGCETVKPIDQFYIAKKGDGYQSWCIKCFHDRDTRIGSHSKKTEVPTSQSVIPGLKSIAEASLEDLMPRLKELGVVEVRMRKVCVETVKL